MSSDSLSADNVDALQRQVAVLTLENAQLKAQLHKSNRRPLEGSDPPPREIPTVKLSSGN